MAHLKKNIRDLILSVRYPEKTDFPMPDPLDFRDGFLRCDLSGEVYPDFEAHSAYRSDSSLRRTSPFVFLVTASSASVIGLATWA